MTSATPPQSPIARKPDWRPLYLGDSGLDTIRAVFKSLPPAPKVDRVAVHDDRALSRFERREPTPSLAAFDSLLPPALLGIPVVLDEKVEIGVIELRKGDEVVERLHLLELRA